MKICPACDARFDGSTWSCPSCEWNAPLCDDVPSLGTSESVEGFSGEFFPALDQVERTHFWFPARNALITWAIRRYFSTARTFLEVGCGTGQVSRAIQRACPELQLTASEAFLEGLILAKSMTTGVDFVQADLLRLPWDGEFDLIGAFDVLEHVCDHDGAVAQMRRALRPGGGLMITVPQHRWLWSPMDDIAKHERRYTRGELVALLQRAGFRVERVTSFVSLLLPALLASRLSIRERPADNRALFNLSPVVNGTGRSVMKLEHAMIRAGVSFPAGGSLLALARRID